MNERPLSVAQLKSLLAYDPETGAFRWVSRPSSHSTKIRIGSLAGGRKGHGYWEIKICGRNHKAHRLAWAFYYGSWPSSEIDHINGNRLDNRIHNLREASHAENMANKTVQSNNSIGIKGVRFHKLAGRYEARIRKNGNAVYLGLFDTAEEASRAYQAAARRMFGDFAFGGADAST